MLSVYNEIEESENIVNIMRLIVLCALGGLILTSLCSVVWFTFYHCKCNFKSDLVRLGPDEIVIRNAAGDTVIIRFVHGFQEILVFQKKTNFILHKDRSKTGTLSIRQNSQNLGRICIASEHTY